MRLHGVKIWIPDTFFKNIAIYMLLCPRFISRSTVTRQDARFSSKVAANLSLGWICTNGILWILLGTLIIFLLSENQIYDMRYPKCDTKLNPSQISHPTLAIARLSHPAARGSQWQKRSSYILYPVSCILYPVSCILYPVSRILTLKLFDSATLRLRLYLISHIPQLRSQIIGTSFY